MENGRQNVKEFSMTVIISLQSRKKTACQGINRDDSMTNHVILNVLIKTQKLSEVFQVWHPLSPLHPAPRMHGVLKYCFPPHQMFTFLKFTCLHHLCSYTQNTHPTHCKGFHRLFPSPSLNKQICHPHCHTFNSTNSTWIVLMSGFMTHNSDIP